MLKQNCHPCQSICQNGCEFRERRNDDGVLDFCPVSCSPSDFYEGGKCDLNGCYKKQSPDISAELDSIKATSKRRSRSHRMNTLARALRGLGVPYYWLGLNSINFHWAFSDTSHWSAVVVGEVDQYRVAVSFFKFNGLVSVEIIKSVDTNGMALIEALRSVELLPETFPKHHEGL